MAYTPKTWSCGEVITDTGLNNIEQGIQEALAGGGSSLPEVTTDDNGDVLTVVDGEWEKAEPGFKCTETSTTLTEESVTTTQPSGAPFAGGVFSYSTPINADSLIVTFNGTEYEVNKIDLGGGSCAYGGFSNGYDFSEYPFAIMSNPASNGLFTGTAGTYAVKVETVSETIETSECFAKAVEKAVPPLKYVKDYVADNGGVVENTVVGASAVRNGQAYVVTEETANKATGEFAHAEGGALQQDYNTGEYYFAGNLASGIASHAEGGATTASGDGSHAEGWSTTASGNGSHAEGNATTASGIASHAEGFFTTASGDNSHAEGYGTEADHRSQHVFGEYNVADPSTATGRNRGTYIEIVGNGANPSNRSNARTLDWQGNEWLAGSITLGSTTLTETQLQQLLALLETI